jgi:hypothetical protein
MGRATLGPQAQNLLDPYLALAPITTAASSRTGDAATAVACAP